MDYWQLRGLVKELVPRHTRLMALEQGKQALVREKGRKRNYYQYDVLTGKAEKHERLLNTAGLASAVEVSCRAASCPMCLNLDVWDGFRCSYRCLYCFANYFRASLYSSFFDNSRSLGLRCSNPDVINAQIDAIRNMKAGTVEVKKAMMLRMPLRFGIRFEDFLPIEGNKRVSLRILQHLAQIHYPVMINTKSTLVARSDYIRALADNPAGAAVHITLLTTDEGLSRVLDVHSPTATERFAAAKILTDAGILVVLRIEPFMVLINDQKNRVDEYIGRALDAGVRHMTFDTYSYSALSVGIRRAFLHQGIDFERMFLLTSDAQWLGSLMLSRMMMYFQAAGLSSSTFDFGSAPINSQDICCSVGDGCFKDAGYNWGNNMNAIRFILSRKEPTRWRDFAKFVLGRGGWLSDTLREEVRRAWNLDSGQAYSPDWVPGLEIGGDDEDGLIWRYRPGRDFRVERLRALTGQEVD